MIRWLSNLKRIGHIYVIVLKYGLDKILWSSKQFSQANRLILFFPHRWLFRHEPPPPQNIRQALEELGPIYVKVGQLLSTRRDLLPEDIADELAKLQDNVPPFTESAQALVEQSLKKKINDVFAEFEETPLASASIAQVHRAQLKDGTDVVVKILRPHIQEAIQKDVRLLESLAHLMERLFPKIRRFRPLDVVREIKQTLEDELDLLREAANACVLKRNFKNTTLLYVPTIYWEYSTQSVLTIERIHATRISDMAHLRAEGTNFKVLAERGVEIFFTQVFRDSFFHADMHPGNIFVNTQDPQNPQYIAVDFGIMGTLGPGDKRYLGENFLAFFKRDYRRVAELHIESGWVSPHTCPTQLESDIRTVCEPIFEKPLKDISFGQTLLRLFQVARRFDMQIQPQLILLQKTLINVEGLGRELYPDLDLWVTAKPFLERWMKEQYGLKKWRETIPMLPKTLLDMITHRKHQANIVRHSQRKIEKKPARSHRFLGAMLVLGALASQMRPEAAILPFALCIGVGFYFLLVEVK